MDLNEAVSISLENAGLDRFIDDGPDGVPIFKDTLIPVYAPLDILAEGAKISEVLDEFPELTRSHIKAAIRLASDVLMYASTRVDEKRATPRWYRR